MRNWISASKLDNTSYWDNPSVDLKCMVKIMTCAILDFFKL